MGKWLTGSAKTGEKIIANQGSFSSTFVNVDDNLYSFNWTFNEQYGYASITIKDGKISTSSLIDTYRNSYHKFNRPLGLYNDDTLYDVFREMMKSIGIIVVGVYSSI